jgi:hypothetical protein
VGRGAREALVDDGEVALRGQAQPLERAEGAQDEHEVRRQLDRVLLGQLVQLRLERRRLTLRLSLQRLRLHVHPAARRIQRLQRLRFAASR